MRKAETYKQTRNLFIEKLGLEQMPGVSGHDGSEFLKFNWPRRNNGTQFDRMVLIQVFPDGSWGAYLDNAHLNVEQTIADFRAMAAAG